MSGYLQLLVVSSRTDRLLSVTDHKEIDMKRRKMSKKSSKNHFKKNTGVQKLNHVNPRSMRGGIRL